MNIDNRTRQALEFDLILNRLKTLCMSEEGPYALDKAKFIEDEAKLNEEQLIVDEFLHLFEVEGDPRYSFPSIFQILHHLKPENPLLAPEELYTLAKFMTTASEFRSYLLKERELFAKEAPTFFQKLYLTPTFDGRAVLTTFDSQGNLLESHPDVIQMNQEKASLNAELRERTQRIFASNRDFMQEDRPVVRGGRLLLPIKSNFKGRIPGIVHEVSASGNTLFVESVDLMDLNNKMVELDNRLRQIVYKWQKIFSKQFREVFEELQQIHYQLIQLDLYCAKARYARLYHCSKPSIGKAFELREVVHPALGESAIAANFVIDSDRKIIVISGPNAGGKTVLLKTVSLAILMNQFGMFIHAAEGSKLPLFHSVISAIGDNQSIEEGASTFSGYMRRVNQILQLSTPETLVLLDELGSGTDPSEGSVLGVAIIEALEKKGATALVTTHHKDIRNYVQASEKGINLSMMFDEKRSLPTYQIKVGRPGESRAIEIAAANGLPRSLIATAKRLLKENRSESLNLMDKLSRKENELEEKEKEVEEKKVGLRERIRQLDLKDLQLKQKELEIKKEKQREINAFLQASRSKLDKLVEELALVKKEYEQVLAQSNISLNSKTTHNLKNPNVSGKVQSFFSELQAGAQAREEKIEAIRSEVVQKTGYHFEVGMKVLVGPYKRKGEIVAKGKKNNWLVLMESVKIMMDESDLVPDFAANNQKPDVKVEVVREITTSKPELVMDLRGNTLDEALAKLYKQIELAIMYQMESFSIIHGLGEGVLQQGIRAELRKIPAVTDFYYARPELGGNGRTEVILG